MRHLRICATKLDANGNPYVSFDYDHEGEAFVVFKNGFVTIIDIHAKGVGIVGKIRLSDYEDVSIYNY